MQIMASSESNSDVKMAKGSEAGAEVGARTTSILCWRGGERRSQAWPKTNKMIDGSCGCAEL